MSKPAFIDQYRVLDLQQATPNCDIFLCADADDRRHSVMVFAERGSDEDTLRRIQQEGPMLAELAAIPEIAAPTGFTRQPLGFVLPELPTASLAFLLQSSSTPPAYETIQRWMLGVLRALEGAHERGIVHRALTASLVFVDSGPTPTAVRVAGFGLATILESEKTWSQTGTMVGDIHYLAPEHFLSQPIDARTDVYAAGILLYELCTGKKPFQADSVFGVMQGHCSQPLPDPTTWRPDIDPRIVEVMRRATAKRPAERYANGAAMRLAFRDATAGLTRPQPAFGGTIAAPLFGTPGSALDFMPEPSPPIHRDAPGGPSAFLPQQSPQTRRDAPGAQQPLDRQWSGASAGRGAVAPPAVAVGNAARAQPAAEGDARARHLKNAGQWTTPSPSMRGPMLTERPAGPSRRLLFAVFGGLTVLFSAVAVVGFFVNDDTGKLKPKHDFGSETLYDRAPAQGDLVFEGTCTWIKAPAPMADAPVLLHDEAGASPDVVVSHSRLHARVEGLRVPESVGDRLEWGTSAVESTAVWHDDTLDRMWLFLVLAKSSDQPPRLIVLQVEGRQLITAHDIPLSLEDLSSTELTLVPGSRQCEVRVDVHGDTGGGPPDKSMQLRPDPDGITVSGGALGYLWVEDALFEGLSRTNFSDR